MLNTLSQLKHTFISVTIFNLVCLGNFNYNQSTQAQTSQGFNQKQCINELTKTGLDKNQAIGWCEYQKECLTESQAQGLPLEVAEDLCDCSLEKFRERYTLSEFQELNQQATNNPEIDNKLREVGETCFEDILFSVDTHSP